MNTRNVNGLTPELIEELCSVQKLTEYKMLSLKMRTDRIFAEYGVSMSYETLRNIYKRNKVSNRLPSSSSAMNSQEKSFGILKMRIVKLLAKKTVDEMVAMDLAGWKAVVTAMVKEYTSEEAERTWRSNF